MTIIYEIECIFWRRRRRRQSAQMMVSQVFFLLDKWLSVVCFHISLNICTNYPRVFCPALTLTDKSFITLCPYPPKWPRAHLRSESQCYAEDVLLFSLISSFLVSDPLLRSWTPPQSFADKSACEHWLNWSLIASSSYRVMVSQSSQAYRLSQLPLMLLDWRFDALMTSTTSGNHRRSNILATKLANNLTSLGAVTFALHFALTEGLALARRL